eukprot:TRINITY_DN5027_c7_g1_i1.p1 TRINITY_DN5027_c7_g1~~TRINITY_DN5027_c7_g1_i1.p1  ORF type:complete len:740 (+),score=241.57 TRINITY_DN5027_c7_g1_i1:76-2220(+)
MTASPTQPVPAPAQQGAADPAPTPEQGRKQYSPDFLKKFQQLYRDEPEPGFRERMSQFTQSLPAAPSSPTTLSAAPSFELPRDPSASTAVSGLAGGRDSMFGVSASASPFLAPSESAYRVRGVQELSEMERLTKHVSGILNKMTPEKYEDLSQQLFGRETEVTTNSAYMKRTIELIFTRAVEQPQFCEMYAKLSSQLAAQELHHKQQEAGGVAQAASLSQFRRQLLDVVQREFEDRIRESGEARGLGDEAQARARRRKLGNIRFVGELHNNRLLTPAIMHRVLVELLYGRGTTKEQVLSSPPHYLPPEDDIEVLCQLLQTIGAELEQRISAAASQAPPPQQQQQLVARYFSTMETLAAHMGYPPRIRFLLIDTIDYRRHGWPDKKPKARKLEEALREHEARRERSNSAVHTGQDTAWGKSAAVAASLTDMAEEAGARCQRHLDPAAAAAGYANRVRSRLAYFHDVRRGGDPGAALAAGGEHCEQLAELAAPAAGGSPQLLCRELCDIAARSSSAAARSDTAQLLRALCDSGSIVATPDALAGLGAFAGDCAAEQLREDLPQVYPRIVGLVGAVFPSATHFGQVQQLTAHALGTCADALRRRGEEQHAAEAAGELFAEAWCPLHAPLAAASCGVPQLAALASASAEAGWPQAAPAGTSVPQPLLALQLAALLRSGALTPRQLAAWHGALAQGAGPPLPSDVSAAVAALLAPSDHD